MVDLRIEAKPQPRRSLRVARAVLFVMIVPFAGLGVAALALLIISVWVAWCAAELASLMLSDAIAAMRASTGWQYHHSNGAWSYQINPTSGQRRALYVAGHSLVDYHWLRPGDYVVDEIGRRVVIE